MGSGDVVELRAKTDADEAVLYRIAADLESWEERSPAAPAPLTLAAYRERVASGALDRDASFVIAVDGQAIGTVSLFHEDPLSRHAGVGIALLPEERGKGYGSEALRQVVDFAFTRRNLRRVYLSVLASNAAALASYRKVGFVEEGRRREHCWVRGRYEDEVTMGLLRSQCGLETTPGSVRNLG